MKTNNSHTWKGATLWPTIQETLSLGKQIIVYDLETSGLSKVNDRIIEIAAIKFTVDDSLQFHEVDVYHEYIDPGFPISDKIIDLTHITNEQLAESPLEDALYPSIKQFFADCVVAGYNIDSFDNKFLGEMYGRYGDFFSPPGVIDGLPMARNRLTMGTDVENYKLATVGAYYGFDFTAHSAIEDARTTARIIQQLINEYIQHDEDAKVNPPAKETISLRPKLLNVEYWAGFKGFSRIYVNTDMGSVFYDTRTRTWGGRDVDINNFDMAYVEHEAFNMTQCKTEQEFAKFKGSVRAKETAADVQTT